MRAILIPILCIASSLLASPEITVHISPQDVRQIRAVISAPTSEPILDIYPVCEKQPVPGSIPIKGYTSGPIRYSAITCYARTDKVIVSTVRTYVGNVGKRVNPIAYIVQKVGETWKIQSTIPMR
jgi:hypothetical protein